MDKNAIKKYAVWARRELIARVSQRAEQYGITEREIIDENAEKIHGAVLSSVQIRQRQALIRLVRRDGFQQAMEEVAYTWFNRFIALRFMEVNDYLPAHTRAFTDEQNAFRPKILSDALNLESIGLSIDKVIKLKESNQTEELYQYLLITLCNHLSAILPGMFQKIDDYTELLFPEHLLREGSVLQQLVAMIPQEDWLDAVQIIGWLYQYYNAEPKDQVFANLKKNIKIGKKDIPAATQLFTPDWIVRYMVENSLGRLWVEGHPNEELKAEWKYYLEEAEQEPEVQAQLQMIREQYAQLKPEDILCVDPCAGSGHILVYLFDVLVQIYEAYGYPTREAVANIVQNNLWGMDIDDRAAQLAYFAVMMKARQYDKGWFRRGIEPHVFAIQDSGDWVSFEGRMRAAFAKHPSLYEGTALRTAKALFEVFTDAKEYGSILQPEISLEDLTGLEEALDDLARQTDMMDLAAQSDAMSLMQELKPLILQCRGLVQKYDIVITNPPYAGRRNLSAHLCSFLDKHYPITKMDLFSAFIENNLHMTKENGFSTYMTPFVWLFLGSYSGLRSYLLDHTIIDSFIQPEENSFEEAAVSICSFAMRKTPINYCGTFVRLSQFGDPKEQEKRFLEAVSNKCVSWRYNAKMQSFQSFPDQRFVYWVSKTFASVFNKGRILDEVCQPRQGMATTNNDLFLRLWYEVSFCRIGFGCHDEKEAYQSGQKWFPYNKGGGFRRWYGNYEYIVNYENNGKTICDYIDNTPGARVGSNGRVINRQFFFRESITWSDICGNSFAARACPNGFIFDVKGSSGFVTEDMYYYILAFLNSILCVRLLNALNPTITTQVGDLKQLPLLLSPHETIDSLTKTVVSIAKADWDSFETSWDFQLHPFLYIDDAYVHDNGAFGVASAAYYYGEGPAVSSDIEACFLLWQKGCRERFYRLKANEEELNRIFIEIYGLQDELTPEVAEKDVTVRKADLGREIRSLISYAVGCMLGRYSLDKPGLQFAGGDWPEWISQQGRMKYSPDRDGILPITDDEYFGDDIVTMFVEWVKKAFDESRLEENLKFIAYVLQGGSYEEFLPSPRYEDENYRRKTENFPWSTINARTVIRQYFLNDFYRDHLKIYQKRPIYWMFDSGKKNGFKCLVYMHRWQKDTVARVRTDYVHEMQSRYRTAIEELSRRVDSASGSERVRLQKQLAKIQAQDAELLKYEEKVHHLADQMIAIDLDDGVKHNYAIFADVLAPIK